MEFERIRGEGHFQEMAMIFLDLILLYEKVGKLENAAQLILHLEEVVAAIEGRSSTQFLADQRIRLLITLGKT